MDAFFNFTKITDELGMDAEDILQLMAIYGPELRKDMLALDSAIGIPDWALLKSKLHKMKGDAANMCLPALTDVFAKMEKALPDLDLEALVIQLNNAKAIESRFISELESYINAESKV